jgi:DNA-binding NtrC family response regulator
LQLRVPALAERRQDILDLSYEIHARLGRKHHRTFPPLRDGHITILRDYDWPGNIRQLRTVLERALLLGMLDQLETVIDEERRVYGVRTTAPSQKTSELALDEKVSEPALDPPSAPAELTSLREMNRRYANHALALLDNNLRRTARTLGISVNRLKRIRAGAAAKDE